MYIGIKMKKLIDFKNLYKEIQKYASNYFEDNFSMAVRHLILRGLMSEKQVPFSLANKKELNNE